MQFIKNTVEILWEMTAYITSNLPEIQFIRVTTDHIRISKYYEQAIVDRDLKEAESWLKFSIGLVCA